VTKNECAYPCVDDQLADPGSMLNYCKAVNHARLRSPLIARGVNTTLYADKNVVLMKRELDGECCYIAINFAKKADSTVEIPATGLAIVSDLVALEGNATLAEGDGVTTVTLPPYGIAVIE